MRIIAAGLFCLVTLSACAGSSGDSPSATGASQPAATVTYSPGTGCVASYGRPSAFQSCRDS
jgi:hypothetical protein